MTRKLLLLAIALLFVVSYGCAKKAAAPCPAAGPEGAAAPAAPSGAAPGAAPAPTEEGLAAPQAPGGAAVAEEAAPKGSARERFESEDVYFDFDSYDLSPQATATLDAKVSYLKANPNAGVRVEGNCDERGSTEYNLALGERRAQAAKKYLVNAGVKPGRIDTVSYGEEKPADPSHNEEAWAKNRRDHFVIIG